MKFLTGEQFIRLGLTLAILLAGVAMIPFVDLPVGAIGWETLAGVYAPELTVNETSGIPGSTFAFTGSGYPANSLATVYVNGETSGNILTDGAGTAAFNINTIGVPPGPLNVTLEVDINASATRSIDLVVSGSLVVPPEGSDAPTFFAGHPVFMPVFFH